MSEQGQLQQVLVLVQLLLSHSELPDTTSGSHWCLAQRQLLHVRSRFIHSQSGIVSLKEILILCREGKYSRSNSTEPVRTSSEPAASSVMKSKLLLKCFHHMKYYS